jgi:hypothetical protein
MGGIGSGYRWGAASKRTTNDCLSIDVRRWHRDGLLTAGASFCPRWYRDHEMVGCILVCVESNRVLLGYHVDEIVSHQEIVVQPVYISWSSCNYGGKRPWLICPMTGCGRRVAILYRQYTFACRHCNQLAYLSQNETVTDRLTRRADAIREILGWEQGIFNGKALRPKGMHSRRFERLVMQHDYYALSCFNVYGKIS